MFHSPIQMSPSLWSLLIPCPSITPELSGDCVLVSILIVKLYSHCVYLPTNSKLLKVWKLYLSVTRVEWWFCSLSLPSPLINLCLMLHGLHAINKLTILVQRSLASLSPRPLPRSRWEAVGLMLGYRDIGLERELGQIYWQLQYKILMGENKESHFWRSDRY